MDAAAIGQASGGWHVVHHGETPSTNDLALRGDLGPRAVVVADRQTAGRGRAGRAFASPQGGLYASLVLAVPPEDVPAGVVALVALAGAEAIEALVPADAAIKWPNDLWLAGRKVGGILLERREDGAVVAGIGINIAATPTDLPPALADHVTHLAAHGAAPTRDDALLALLAAVDRLTALRGGAEGLAAIEAPWRARLALIGVAVSYRLGGTTYEGVLEDVSLREGLLVRDPVSGPVWRAAEHVQDLRPAGRTI